MKMGNGNGEGEGHEQSAKNFLDSIKRTSDVQQFANSIAKMIGSVVGYGIALFIVPLLIVYAYNGLQPAVWPDISYLPTVAGLFSFRVLIHMTRRE